jgi:hypothetical protein
MHSYIVCREHPSTHRHGLEVLGLESQYAAIGELDVVAASCIVVARGKALSAIQLRLGLQPVDLDLLAQVWRLCRLTRKSDVTCKPHRVT